MLVETPSLLLHLLRPLPNMAVDLVRATVFHILTTSKFYRCGFFKVGSTLIPGVSAMHLVLFSLSRLLSAACILGLEEQQVWRRCFADAFAKGLAAEVQVRDWVTAKGLYLDCWKMLLDVEPPKRTSNRIFNAEGAYDWICMCVGTRLICVYQYTRDFPKALAVLAWIQRRQLYPQSDGLSPLNNWWAELERHKALLLFQWSWAEELAGNLHEALRLQNLAFEHLQEAAEMPVPAQVLLSGSWARIAADTGHLDEARLWSRTAFHYWELDCVRYSDPHWETALKHGLSRFVNPRWAYIIRDFYFRQKKFLYSPTVILPRPPLLFDNSVHQFYTELDPFPRVQSGLRVFKLGFFPRINWEQRFMVQFEAARDAYEDEQWEVAESRYLTCKSMILEEADENPAFLFFFKSTALLIGTQLANIYQWHLHDFQKCGVILEWLSSMVEPHEISPQLSVHQCQVAFQSQRANGKDGHEAVQQLEQVMALPAYTSPLPDLSAILCLGLAVSCVLINSVKAHEWLTQAFRDTKEWHPEWQVALGMERLNIYRTMKDFTAVRDCSLKLISFLDAIAPSQLEANVHWPLLSKCYRTLLDACFLMDGHGKSTTDVGLQWDVEATHLETNLRYRVMDLLEKLEVHPLNMLDDVDIESSNHLAVVEFTPAGGRMAGYALCRSLREAICRASLSESCMKMTREDYDNMLSCAKLEIFFAEDMLSASQHAAHQELVSGWHYLVGLSYTRLGELVEEQADVDETKLDNLKCTYETASYHLQKVDPNYVLNAQLEELLGFSHLSRSAPGDLDDAKFCALSGVAFAMGLKLRLQPARTVLEMNAFLEAVAQAEVYSRLPRQTILEQFAAYGYPENGRLPSRGNRQATAFYDGLLIKIIEKREQRVNTQSTWTRVLDVRRVAMLEFLKSMDPVTSSTYVSKYMTALRVLTIDTLVWLEQGLSNVYMFQWLRFYSQKRPSYYSEVSQCWQPNPTQNPSAALWSIIFECWRLCQTPPILMQVYYQLSKGEVTTFIIRDKNTVIGKSPLPLSVDVEKILRKFFSMKSCEDATETLKLLYKILIKPISEFLINTSKVVFIAEQILARVPFAILIDPETGKYLFQQYTVSVAPSTLALWHCIKRYTSTASEREADSNFPLKPALVIADPAYANLSLFPRLTHSIDEIRAIQNIFEKSGNLEVEKKEGREANVKAVLEAAESPGGSRSFIHFAVHAGTEQKNIPHTDSGKLQYGGIKQGTVYLADPRVEEWPPAPRKYRYGRQNDLGPCERGESVSNETDNIVPAATNFEGGDDDITRGSVRRTKKMSHSSEWQLRADDDILVREKPWNVDMVVLSACNSSRGQVLQSGAYLNLPRALTLAGVPCIVTAQWKVEDADSTPRLMEYFYQGMDEGLDAATALQVSMQKMLDDGYSLFQWGAFMVWGLPTVRLPHCNKSVQL